MDKTTLACFDSFKGKEFNEINIINTLCSYFNTNIGHIETLEIVPCPKDEEKLLRTVFELIDIKTQIWFDYGRSSNKIFDIGGEQRK